MDTKEQLRVFFESCDDIKKCKFIMATTKIKDLLKTIVNCPDLYRLFEAVTKDFDYPAAKEKCFVTTDDGIFSKSYVLLPQTVGHRLAFIFCLFVEFDRDSINLNDFLRKYYPADGSYFESYRAFCSQIIDSLRECVTQVFKDSLPETGAKPVIGNAKKAELISALNIQISEEIRFVSENESLSDDDRERGLKILYGLLAAVKDGDARYIEAVVCGYNYFVSGTQCMSETLGDLLVTLVDYGQCIAEETE